MKKVAVIMGSDSDLPVLKGAFEQLKKLGFPLRRMFIRRIGHLLRRRAFGRVRSGKAVSAC